MTLALRHVPPVVCACDRTVPLRSAYSHELSGFLHPVASGALSLLDKRLVVVTGKGGVGKTTVAAALGLAAARRGKRMIVCEVAEQERLDGAVRPGAGYAESASWRRAARVSIDPERAKEEWLRYQLRSGTLAGLLGGSRIFQYLTAAAPGLTELVTIGKVWDLAQLERRDRRARSTTWRSSTRPATGHGLAMLRAPRTYASIARVGPIRRQAPSIDAFVRDPAQTGVLAVALPEEMPVNETIDLERALPRRARHGDRRRSS